MDERNFENTNETVNYDNTTEVIENTNGADAFDNSAFSQAAPENSGSENKGMAIASMICGIASVVLVCCTSFSWLGLLCAVAAIVLFIFQKKQHGKNGMATAGLVCGIVAIAIYVICLIIVAVAGAALGAAGLYDLIGSYY